MGDEHQFAGTQGTPHGDQSIEWTHSWLLGQLIQNDPHNKEMCVCVFVLQTQCQTS
jgi:hypothetical protein